MVFFTLFQGWILSMVKKQAYFFEVEALFDDLVKAFKKGVYDKT
jgi:hypothetical protein